MSKNNLDYRLVWYVMQKYFKSYLPKYKDDLYSYGLEALYRADRDFVAEQTTKNFKYFATCVIRRAMSLFVRDKIPKFEKESIIYTDKFSFLDNYSSVETIDHNKMDLRDSIDKLPDEMRNIIIHRYFEDKTFVEIGKIYNKKSNYIIRQHDKALNLLRKGVEIDENV